ncbi:MAG: D-alanyl-D-alanine carboxypeptidase (penicillin-binding protein 5/6) [Gammaproteobacteria bacterium]|jgi:D-alanyl-D-alanine carboxypeptidase (penicillin-binding protein 5/6)
MTTLRLPRSLLASLFVIIATAASMPAKAISIVPTPPQLDANSYILFDYASGQLLAERDSSKAVEPASITKLMTVYVAFKELSSGNLTLTDKVLISRNARHIEGSRMFVELGSQVSVRDLLMGIIVQSGNDASIALAEHIAGSEGTFAQLMNQYAESLGMRNTNFNNATGLPSDGHLTTARDIALLSSALIREFPEYYGWYSTREYTYNGITQQNRNTLLFRDRSVDGLKTGHTDAAGYCLAASAIRDNMRLVSVVLGTPSSNARVQATQALLNFGFRFFQSQKVLSSGKSLQDQRVWEGDMPTVALGASESVFVTVPRGKRDSIETIVDLDGPLFAPLAKGTKVGFITVLMDGKELVKEPLVTLDEISEGAFMSRMKDKLLIMFN